MPIFKKIEEKDASGKVKEIYEDIKNKRQINEIPNFWKTMANSPDTLERTWNSLQQVIKCPCLYLEVHKSFWNGGSISNNIFITRLISRKLLL